MKAKNKLAIVFFPAFDWEVSPTHPERKERLLYTMDQIKEEGIEDIEGIDFFNPIVADEKDISRVHFCVPNTGDILSKSHYISAGGAIKAMEETMNKNVDKSFALIRPPGHHANRIVYGSKGFCVINNEAIMIEKMRKKYGDLKVAIIDTDCHHGDGTEDIYWNDKNTLFISIHQDGRTLYPGTGFIGDLGGPAAFGYNINIPLPPQTGDEGILYILEKNIMPILEDFKPDIIVNSARQDNHFTDPLTNMNFTAKGYARLNEILNPHISVLEGGYSIEGALPYINIGIILAMAGIDYSNMVEPGYDKSKLKQSKNTNKQIEKISDDIKYIWENKELFKEDYMEKKNIYKRERNIFFDTDNIMETQTQNFNECKYCASYDTIKSISDNGYNIFAITIPNNTCKDCIKKAYELYDDSSKAKYTNIYLQDRVNDKYKSR
ncbi:histone deacetylase family protein [Senegalia sp. (in: firmicutes)]|uniref:histone deacetylase family protein n=2 Tax=Senegalia sp. (in: firmicutes) TaxID=1924098 RepID=UPI003F9A0A32